MALSLKQVALVCAAVSSVTRQPSANPRLVAEVLREWDETASDEVEDDAWEGPIRAWLGRAGKSSVGRKCASEFTGRFAKRVITRVSKLSPNFTVLTLWMRACS